MAASAAQMFYFEQDFKPDRIIPGLFASHSILTILTTDEAKRKAKYDEMLAGKNIKIKPIDYNLAAHVAGAIFGLLAIFVWLKYGPPPQVPKKDHWQPLLMPALSDRTKQMVLFLVTFFSSKSSSLVMMH
jgi:hypothetical protein